MSSRDEVPPHIEAWQQETWTFYTGQHHEDAFPIYADYCVFHEGEHYPGRYCPHDDEVDEMGPVMPPGWTVLDNR